MTCQKIKYKGTKTAVKAMLQMIRRGIQFEKIGAYRCKKCDAYHITTKKIYEEKTL